MLNSNREEKSMLKTNFEYRKGIFFILFHEEPGPEYLPVVPLHFLPPQRYYSALQPPPIGTLDNNAYYSGTLSDKSVW